ncbi:uncharacterized protein LOC141647174 [Silene latifolia]|uniref:uncharacterized protein LOC141647174 n=1 Tax=Silene latifolia TaxID=37657 RepID=UPI003D780BF6
MFSRGDTKSIMLLLRAFKTFSKASGLCMNQEKSNIYSNGVDEGTMATLVRISGMKRGTILFKYLGVNISPKRLSVADCQCLTDKVVSRMRGLGATELSYAGRVVLIRSVMSTLHNYWARIFIFPKTILNKIEQLCRKFLRHGNEMKDSPSLVSWAQICKSRKKGGLGFKSMYWWNVAAVAKYTWWIARKTGHLWVRWIHDVYMKGKCWREYKPGSGVSWTRRKICWVKDLMQHHLFSGNFEVYTIRLGYSWLVNEGPDQTWHPWIANKLMIPRHGFNLWLVAHRRLLTQDKLVRLGIAQSNLCYLCGTEEESMEHLFFKCDYSRMCSRLMGDWLQTTIPDSQVIDWWLKLRTKSLKKKKVLASVLVALMYQIWSSRNKCRFEGFLCRPEELVRKCKVELKMKFRCNNVKSKFRGVCTWLDGLCQS